MRKNVLFKVLEIPYKALALLYNSLAYLYWSGVSFLINKCLYEVVVLGVL